MKDELGEENMKEFVGLRSKTYIKTYIKTYKNLIKIKRQRYKNACDKKRT